MFMNKRLCPKHGEKGTYSIIVRNNNTGFWTDNYRVEVESDHNWTVELDEEIPDLTTYYDTKKEFVLKVNISVPEFTEISKDKLTIKIISNEAEDHGREENITIITA